MNVDTDGRLLVRVAESLRPRGWRPSSDEPVVVLPRPGTFVRPLESGWAATLTLASFTRDEVELSPWRPGMQQVVEIESATSFPPAEILAAHLGVSPGLDFDAAPPFSAPGDGASLRQLRGPEDVDGVVVEIVAYAEDVVVPAAHDAGLDDWLADYRRISREDPEVLVRQIPLMLVAHGCTAEALIRLRTALRDPELATPELTAFAGRLERFVGSAAPLPTDGAELVALAAEQRRRCAAARASLAVRQDAARRTSRSAIGRVAVATAGAGPQASGKRRRDDGRGA